MQYKSIQHVTLYTVELPVGTHTAWQPARLHVCFTQNVMASSSDDVCTLNTLLMSLKIGVCGGKQGCKRIQSTYGRKICYPDTFLTHWNRCVCFEVKLIMRRRMLNLQSSRLCGKFTGTQRELFHLELTHHLPSRIKTKIITPNCK
jgi:hypothetical protein